VISVTNRESGKAAYLPEECIVEMTEHKSGDGSGLLYTRVHIEDSKQHHDYTLDILESKKDIKKLIEEARKNGRKKKFTDSATNDS